MQINHVRYRTFVFCAIVSHDAAILFYFGLQIDTAQPPIEPQGDESRALAHSFVRRPDK
jgi:hypothetical protein